MNLCNLTYKSQSRPLRALSQHPLFPSSSTVSKASTWLALSFWGIFRKYQPSELNLTVHVKNENTKRQIRLPFHCLHHFLKIFCKFVHLYRLELFSLRDRTETGWHSWRVTRQFMGWLREVELEATLSDRQTRVRIVYKGWIKNEPFQEVVYIFSSLFTLFCLRFHLGKNVNKQECMFVYNFAKYSKLGI